jgi:SAM-dependent methyltransferase
MAGMIEWSVMKRRDLLIAPIVAPIVAPAVFERLSGQDKQVLRAPDVRYEPSTEIITLAMLKLAKVTSKDVVYDLGCGDGRVVIMAVKEFGASGVGIDIDPERIKESRANAAKAGVKSRIEFRTGDLFEADISKATVVMLYLWPWVNLKLRPKLLKELKPGTRVVSHSHNMGDWVPEKTIEIEGDEIHLWTIPKPEKDK